jgi:chitodextrinase
MYTGVQWTGTLAAGQTQTWFTWGWNPAKHVVWHVMPQTPKLGAPELN